MNELTKTTLATVLRQHKTGTGWIEQFRTHAQQWPPRRVETDQWRLNFSIAVVLAWRRTSCSPPIAARDITAMPQGDIHRRGSREMTIGISAGSPPMALFRTRYLVT